MLFFPSSNLYNEADKTFFTVCWSAFSSVLPPQRFPVTFSKGLPCSGWLVTAGQGLVWHAEEGGEPGGGPDDCSDCRAHRAAHWPDFS